MGGVSWNVGLQSVTRDERDRKSVGSGCPTPGQVDKCSRLTGDDRLCDFPRRFNRGQTVRST